MVSSSCQGKPPHNDLNIRHRKMLLRPFYYTIQKPKVTPSSPVRTKLRKLPRIAIYPSTRLPIASTHDRNFLLLSPSKCYEASNRMAPEGPPPAPASITRALKHRAQVITKESILLLDCKRLHATVVLERELCSVLMWPFEREKIHVKSKPILNELPPNASIRLTEE